MKNFFLTIILLLTFVTQATAMPLVRVTTEPVGAEPTTKTSLEVTAGEATSKEDAEAAAAWAERDLAEARKTNLALKPEIVVADVDSKGEPQVHAEKRGLKQAVKDLLYKHYRVSFTLIRGVANTTVVTWGLVLSAHVPLLAALPVGLVAGSMSAGFQYYNQKYQAWQLRSKSVVGRMARALFVNVVYMAITKFVALVTGVPHEATFLLATETVLKSAALGTFAQSSWGLGVAQSSKTETERLPEKEAHLRRLNDFKTLAISMVSTALSVASLVGAPITDAAMVGMTGTGALYYTWTAIKARRWNKEKSVREARARVCENTLTR